jgi:hypothetical protein
LDNSFNARNNVPFGIHKHGLDKHFQAGNIKSSGNKRSRRRHRDYPRLRDEITPTVATEENDCEQSEEI